jgi:hypothetical protein
MPSVKDWQLWTTVRASAYPVVDRLTMDLDLLATSPLYPGQR